MATSHQVTRIPVTTSPATAAGLQVTRWVMMILGGIAAFMGGFILVGGDDQYVGLGGEVSWRVGDIDPAWGWGLLIGGLLLLAGGVALLLHHRRSVTAGEAVVGTAGADLLAHAAIFVVVNAFLWTQDLVATGAVNYVLWVTVPWAIGLGIHAFAYAIGRRA